MVPPEEDHDLPEEPTPQFSLVRQRYYTPISQLNYKSSFCLIELFPEYPKTFADLFQMANPLPFLQLLEKIRTAIKINGLEEVDISYRLFTYHSINLLVQHQQAHHLDESHIRPGSSQRVHNLFHTARSEGLDFHQILTTFTSDDGFPEMAPLFSESLITEAFNMINHFDFHNVAQSTSKAVKQITIPTSAQQPLYEVDKSYESLVLIALHTSFDEPPSSSLVSSHIFAGAIRCILVQSENDVLAIAKAMEALSSFFSTILANTPNSMEMAISLLISEIQMFVKYKFRVRFPELFDSSKKATPIQSPFEWFTAPILDPILFSLHNHSIISQNILATVISPSYSFLHHLMPQFVTQMTEKP